MHEGKKAWKKARKEGASREPETGMVLDSLGDDETSAFRYVFSVVFAPLLFAFMGWVCSRVYFCRDYYRRWLTHSISDYYGLDSKSVTVGSPARRVVYVGVKQVGLRGGKHAASASVRLVLPPPLWEMF